MPDGAPPDHEGSNRRIEIESIDPLGLDEALSIIGEQTRARIIVELGEAKTTDPSTSNALGFSQLMRRAGVEDSGRFNYHLDKLVGAFVKKSDDGYTLRLPGQLVYEAVVAGTLTDRQSIEPFQVDECPDCDRFLTAAYHPDHILTVECTGCETLFDAIHFPARGIVERAESELLDAAYRRRHHKVATMRRGVCDNCGSRVRRALESAASITYGSASVDEMAGLEIYAVLECTCCATSLVGHPANVALSDPTVVGFFAEHDRDAATERWWDEPVDGARKNVEVTRENPGLVKVPYTIGDDSLRVLLDSSLQVVDAEGR